MVLIHSTPFEAKWDGSEIEILWSGEDNVLTVKKVNDSVVFTMYANDVEIYSWTSEVNDISKVNIGFLIDDDLEVGKPSFIYDNSDNTVTYNAEEPTDEEMSDIYLWLIEGIPVT